MKLYINWRGLLGMPSKYVGIVYNKETKKVCKIVNPTYDYELHDNCWTKNNSDETMMRIERKDIPKEMTMADCALLIERIEATL